MFALAFVTGASLMIAIAACGAPKLPAPQYVGHPTSALVVVPYPPPPARIEQVPDQPKDERAVWIDGEWVWQTRRYAWRPGRWLVPPPNAKFAPWTSVRDVTGQLYLANGAWRDSSGEEVAEPPALTAGRPRPAAIVSPEGDDVPSGPSLSHDASVVKAREDVDAALAEAVNALDASRMPDDASASSIGEMDAGSLTTDSGVLDSSTDAERP